MSDEMNLDGSVSGEPVPTSQRRHDWRYQVGAVVLIPLLLVIFLELMFGPLHSAKFLRLAQNEEAYKPYALVLGIVLLVLITWLFWSHTKPEDKQFEGVFGLFKLVLYILFVPIMGFSMGWFAITFCVPLVQHQFAAKTEVEHRFTITGFAIGKNCRGVTAINPLFFDDELCGVRRSGHETEWEGRTIVVSGWQSRYGLTWNQYWFE